MSLAPKLGTMAKFRKRQVFLPRMPFGVYRGRTLTELDDNYLAWVTTLPNLFEPLKTEIAEEIDRRARNLCPCCRRPMDVQAIADDEAQPA